MVYASGWSKERRAYDTDLALLCIPQAALQLAVVRTEMRYHLVSKGGLE